VALAPSTACRREASSDRNQTPVLPSGAVTYVRTFVSGNRDAQGAAGRYGGRNTIWNGTSPTQALPSKVSTA
jgi:hypothetical protein